MPERDEQDRGDERENADAKKPERPIRSERSGFGEKSDDPLEGQDDSAAGRDRAHGGWGDEGIGGGRAGGTGL